jgi:hypothetical protein
MPRPGEHARTMATRSEGTVNVWGCLAALSIVAVLWACVECFFAGVLWFVWNWFADQYGGRHLPFGIAVLICVLITFVGGMFKGSK